MVYKYLVRRVVIAINIAYVYVLAGAITMNDDLVKNVTCHVISNAECFLLVPPDV